MSIDPNSDKKQNISSIRLRVSVMLAASVVMFLSGCGEQKLPQKVIRPVKAMVVQAPVKNRVLSYSGVLAPRIDSSLGFRVSGKILERFVNTGDQVHSGQSIARLDEQDLKLAENSARANVTSTQTRLSVAKDALKRANFLLPNGYIAKSAVDQRQLELDSAQSSLDAARDQLNQAVNATSYSLLTADQDGIVTSVLAESGQVVSTGQTVITLAHAGDMEVAVSVPEQEIGNLKPGDPAYIALWASPNINSEGKIREIAGTADSASRTYSVRVSMEKPVPQMRFGMTTAVQFRVAQDTPALFVPLTALIEKDGKTLAYVATRNDETVHARQVTVAGVTDEGTKISSGLQAGDILVIGGVQFLKDGMKVRLPKDVLTSIADTTLSQ